MDDDHMRELGRLPEVSPRRAGARVRYALREEYGDDVYSPETVLIFRRSGRETRLALKKTDTYWRVTGRRRLRSWDGLIRVVGHGYEPLIAE